ncbi:hypothetical protein MRV_0031 [Murid herpesvirus 3]|uniref:Uncharacterized protein n=2 Tax=Murid betaherpesvirus 3 TaxID=2560603 RepID=A0A1P8VIS5_9BETA|nr:hypothetical protein MRV_0031 [Murine roseolovirus]APZ76242.1 hypothetical protein MRV_0031 [Murid betaherpesvirus 3]AYH64723.1 hypothetical protein MRV_0031 [Murid herpesvirus 3]
MSSGWYPEPHVISQLDFNFPENYCDKETLQLLKNVLIEESFKSIKIALCQIPMKAYLTDQIINIIPKYTFAYCKHFIVPAIRLYTLLAKVINNYKRCWIMKEMLESARPEHINYFADMLASPLSGVLLKKITNSFHEYRMTPKKHAVAISEIYNKRANSLGLEEDLDYSQYEPHYRSFISYNYIYFCPNFSDIESINLYKENIKILTFGNIDNKLNLFLHDPAMQTDHYIANDFLFLTSAWFMIHCYKYETDKLLRILFLELNEFCQIFTLVCKQNYYLRKYFYEYVEAFTPLHFRDENPTYKLVEAMHTTGQVLMNAIKACLEYKDLQLCPPLIKSFYLNAQHQCMTASPPISRKAYFQEDDDDLDFNSTKVPNNISNHRFENILFDSDYAILPEMRLLNYPRDMMGPMIYPSVIKYKHHPLKYKIINITEWQWVPYISLISHKTGYSQDEVCKFLAYDFLTYEQNRERRAFPTLTPDNSDTSTTESSDEDEDDDDNDNDDNDDNNDDDNDNNDNNEDDEDNENNGNGPNGANNGYKRNEYNQNNHNVNEDHHGEKRNHDENGLYQGHFKRFRMFKTQKNMDNYINVPLCDPPIRKKNPPPTKKPKNIKANQKSIKDYVSSSKKSKMVTHLIEKEIKKSVDKFKKLTTDPIPNKKPITGTDILNHFQYKRLKEDEDSYDN